MCVCSVGIDAWKQKGGRVLVFVVGCIKSTLCLIRHHVYFNVLFQKWSSKLSQIVLHISHSLHLAASVAALVADVVLGWGRSCSVSATKISSARSAQNCVQFSYRDTGGMGMEKRHFLPSSQESTTFSPHET